MYVSIRISFITITLAIHDNHNSKVIISLIIYDIIDWYLYRLFKFIRFNFSHQLIIIYLNINIVRIVILEKNTYYNIDIIQKNKKTKKLYTSGHSPAHIYITRSESKR